MRHALSLESTLVKPHIGVGVSPGEGTAHHDFPDVLRALELAPEISIPRTLALLVRE